MEPPSEGGRKRKSHANEDSDNERSLIETKNLDVAWCFSDTPMSELIQRHDWASTPLGPIHSWPMAFKTSLSIILTSRFPMVVWLGEELRVIYNDAYMPQMGNKHPRSLGLPGCKVWPEIWDTIGTMLNNVMKTGKPTWSTDQELLMDRHGYVEETYWTYSYSPIRLPSGNVAGIFTAVEETTSRYVSERRLATLRQVAVSASQSVTASDVPQCSLQAMLPNIRDIPFALLYEARDDAPDRLKLVGQVRVASGAPPLADEFTSSPGWQGREVTVSDKIQFTADVNKRPEKAIVLPLSANYTDDMKANMRGDCANMILGVLVLGINPYLRPDHDYYTFAKLISSTLCAALLSAREHERERQKAIQLAELDRAKTAFFHNVSHEFRTPLTLMLGPLDDLVNHSSSSSFQPSQKEALESALRNGKRLLKLVNALLDFARLEAGRVRATYRPTDLAMLVTDLASIFRSACQKAGLDLIIDCPPLGELVYVDKEMIEKIVLNLLSNAFKFTLQGSITVTLRKANTEALISVKDTGAGIPSHELPKIFDRFHRVTTIQGRTHEGTGIGLALVWELAHLHGGTVKVTSTEGVGSDFTVHLALGSSHLPADHVSHEPDQAPSNGDPNKHQLLDWWIDGFDPTSSRSNLVSSPAVSGNNAAAPKGCVMCVDDNEDMLAYVARILSEGGYQVSTAKDGMDALTKLADISSKPVDLIVSDVMMPRLDGRGLLNAIRNSQPPLRDVPVIFLSARAGEEEMSEGVAMGADDYLVKPFSARELLTRVSARIELTRFRLAAAKREQALREQAERASQSKDHFIAMLSHELRTPLTPALMIAEAGESDPTLPENVRQDMKTIASNIRLEVQLISDLLDLTKIRQGKLELRMRSNVNLNQLVPQTVALFHQTARERQISLNVVLSPQPCVVNGDSTRLQQVFWNLIGNAIKFTPPSGIVYVTTQLQGSNVVFRVQDTGVGIEPQEIPRLFGAFEQGSIAVTREFGGLGLGLAIAKQLVTLHGGQIGAESEGVNKGATFTVKLPLVDSMVTDRATNGQAAQLNTELKSLRVLVVEDNPATQAVMARMLQRLGQTCIISSSVQDAIAKLRSQSFDAMLCDIGLPDGSGCDVIKAGLVAQPQLFAAALTGYGTDEDVQRTKEAGFALHLVKPIRLTQLQEFLAAASLRTPVS